MLQARLEIENLEGLSISLGKKLKRRNLGRTQGISQTSARKKRQLKTRFIKKKSLVCKPITKSVNRTKKTTAKKLPDGLHHRRRETTKYRNHKCYKFYRTNHANSNNKNKCCNNLTKGERTPTKELAYRNDIIISKADKEGAVAIMDIEYYVKEAGQQLNNKEAYKYFQHDPTTQTYIRLSNDTITRFKIDKLITENIAKGLQLQQPETPNFTPDRKYIKQETLDAQ